MNLLWEQISNLTEHGLDAFPHQLLVIAAPHIIAALRVTFARRRKLYCVGLSCRVLRPIICVAAVHEELAAPWQTKRQHAEAAHVRGRAGQECQFDGHANSSWT